MNANDLFEIVGHSPDRYVLDAATVQTKEIPMRKRPLKQMWLIAAIVALIALLIGCAAVYVLGLDQMILGTKVIEDRPGVTEPQTCISLQGYVGSPSYQAAKEWYEFEQTYDPDSTILMSVPDDAMSIPEAYQSYNCYTQEMVDKVDEICQKYGLEKQGKIIIPLDEADFYTTLQIDRLVKENAAAQSELTPDYFYQTGTFMLSCDTTLTGEGSPWPYPISYQYRCVMKTDLDTAFLNVGDGESYEQWEYTTGDGMRLLLAISEDKALLIADLENAFVTMNILNPSVGDILTGEQTITRTAMEAFAEIFDFSMTPKRPTDQQIAQLEAKYDAIVAEQEAKQQEVQETFEKYLGRASYDERVRYHLEHDTEAVRMGYTFYDFDGNGVEELVIGRDGYIEYIYTEKDGETAEILGWLKMGDTYLATDGTLVTLSDDTYRFFHVENGAYVLDYWVECRAYWGEETESPWRLCYSAADDRPITEEEYKNYCNSKSRVVLDMYPLTSYPLSEAVSYNTNGRDLTYYSIAESYEELIQNYLTNPVETAPGEFWKYRYALLDLDGNGQEELIVEETKFRAVYTMDDGKMIPMYSGMTCEDAGLNICKGNVVEVIYSYSGQNKAYCYYQMSGTTGKMVEYLRYDAQRDPRNPWFRSTDATGQDISLEPISKAEFDSIRKTYAPIELDWKAAEEYPLNG